MKSTFSNFVKECGIDDELESKLSKYLLLKHKLNHGGGLNEEDYCEYEELDEWFRWDY